MDVPGRLTASASGSERSATIREHLMRYGPGAQRRRVMIDYITGLVAETLGDPHRRVDPATPLTSLGLDSGQLLELRARLQTDLGIPLAATVAWRHPTVDDLAVFLAQLLGAPIHIEQCAVSVVDIESDAERAPIGFEAIAQIPEVVAPLGEVEASATSDDELMTALLAELENLEAEGIVEYDS